MKRTKSQAQVSRLLDSVEWTEHGVESRINSGWLKLERELTLASRSNRAQRLLMPLVLSGTTFAVGIFVGAQYFAGPDLSRALSVGAEQLPASSQPSATNTAPEVVPSVPALTEEPIKREQKHQLGVVEPKSAVPSLEAATSGEALAESEVREIPSAAPVGVEAPSIIVDETPQWQRLADGGEYTAAWLALEQAGGFDQALAGASADRLMLLVDMARAVGQRQRAVMAVQRVIDVYPTDPLAPMAAWSLGNMLERAGDSAGAARAFAKYRALSPQGDFAEDALVRQLRAAAEQGNVALVNQLAAQYQAAFPSGRHLQEITQQQARLANTVEELEEGDEAETREESDSADVEVPDEPEPHESD